MSGHLTDLKITAAWQEWDKQDFVFQKHLFGKLFHTMSFQAILIALKNYRDMGFRISDPLTSQKLK
jgi:hypothetical protein